nr:AAA family ATPase [Myxococcota bacterium]
PRDDAPPGVSLFVGAAGVGKTTTVAKLAARDPDGVALVTTDVHRVGAIEALRAFSERHGIPFSSAATPAQLGRFLEATPGRRVLVDTAGRSRGDRAAFAELARARGIAGRRGDVQLVVSATTQEGDLRDEVARFADLEPAALVVTKVDDTRSLAGLANLLLDEVAPPLAWLGVGQRVPDDLALAEPVSLADRVLGAAP